jgi:hypothetical protein
MRAPYRTRRSVLIRGAGPALRSPVGDEATRRALALARPAATRPLAELDRRVALKRVVATEAMRPARSALDKAAALRTEAMRPARSALDKAAALRTEAMRPARSVLIKARGAGLSTRQARSSIEELRSARGVVDRATAVARSSLERPLQQARALKSEARSRAVPEAMRIARPAKSVLIRAKDLPAVSRAAAMAPRAAAVAPRVGEALALGTAAGSVASKLGRHRGAHEEATRQPGLGRPATRGLRRRVRGAPR